MSSILDNVVIDWRESLPGGADGIYFISGLTPDEFRNLQTIHADLSGDQLIQLIRQGGCDVKYLKLEGKP